MIKTSVYIKNEQIKIKVTPALRALVRKAIKATLEFEDFSKPCEVSVILTDDEKIRELNSNYRNADKPTDVLSFPMETEPGAFQRVLLGDIVLNLERAAAQGELYGHGFERETAFLIIHSVLHLLGYDHEKGKKEEMEMRKRQSAIAEICGYPVNNDEIRGND